MTIRHALALAAALLLGTAQAATVTLKMTDFSNGYGVVSTSLTGAGQFGAGRLAGQLTTNGFTDNSFVTYCTDLFQSFRWNAVYRDYSLVDTNTAHGFTTHQADLLGKLYTGFGDITNTNQSVAFQLSVWEIVNETNAKLDVTTGYFKLNSYSSLMQVTLANSWLTAINQANVANFYNATRLYSPTSQDFVVFDARPRNNSIHNTPEPSSTVLVGAALAGLALLRRRKPV